MVASTDETLNENYRQFCSAVGHLFISFGRLEGTLSAMLRMHLANNITSDMDENASLSLSSAIYGSMRYKTSRDTIRRLAKAEKLPQASNEFLDTVFGQVGHIEDLRDKIAHQVVVAAIPGLGGYWQVSDQTVTRDLKNIKIYVFDVEAVVAAALDLCTAGDRLGGYSQSNKLFTDTDFDLSPIAWQYKPSMLKHVRLESVRNRQSPTPPPQSSEA